MQRPTLGKVALPRDQNKAEEDKCEFSVIDVIMAFPCRLTFPISGRRQRVLASGNAAHAPVCCIGLLDGVRESAWGDDVL